MKELFLTNNLDYLYLFYGAAFFFLGTASLVLHFCKKEKKALPWLWLSLFGFLHAFNEWLDMFSISLSDTRFMEIERGVLLIFSFWALFEFSRRSVQIEKSVRVRSWFYIPFFVILIIAFLNSENYDNFSASIRYALGLTGALLTSYCFWNFNEEKEERAFKGIYKAIAVIFSFYAVSTGFIVPKANFWPAVFFNQAAFFELTHIPVQFLRGLFATIIAFLFIYKATEVKLVFPGLARGARNIKFIFVSLLLFYFVFLCFGYRLVLKVEQHEKDHLKKVIVANARLVVGAIGEFGSSNITPKEGESIYRSYLQIHSRMVELVEIAPFTRALYLVSAIDGKPLFSVGSQGQVFPRGIVPSFGANIPTKAIADAFHSKMPTIDGPYLDSLGHQSFSLFIPIFNKNGQVFNLLGIDLDGLKMQSEILKVRLYVILIVMAFLILLIVGYAFLIVFALKNLELEMQKNNLNKILISLKEAEAQLARSEETFRGILNNSPNAIFGFDRDLRIIFWNFGAERLYGFHKTEVVNEKNPLLSKKITDLFGAAEVEDKIERVFQGQTLQSETIHRIKENRIDVVMTLFPVKDPQERILFGMGLVQDISEHKKLELSLFEERDRLKKIADSIGAGLSLVNKNFEIVWVNGIMESWFGTLDSMQGKKCYKAYQDKHINCENCPTKKTFETGQIESAEHRISLPNGRVMDFSYISSPIKNEQGEVEQVLEMVLDVTNKKRMIEMLEYERALSKNVIDSISDALMVLDCDTKKVIEVNKVFLETHQLKKEEVIGKTCYQVQSHLSPRCEACAFQDVVKSGKTVTLTHIHQNKKTGGNIYEDVTLSPLKDEKSRTIGIIHLAKDVSERKQLEDELRHYSEQLENLVKERTRALAKSEQMFRKLFESAQDGILIIDAESGKIIDVNPYILKLLECKREDLEGQDYRSISYFRESGNFDKAFNELKNKISVFYDDVVLKTCKDKEVTVEFLASLYYVEDKKIIQCNIRDLTEKKKVEKIKTEFVSMVSHELRTPLSAIKEGVEIVADGTQGKLNRDQQECLGIALSNIKRLNRLIGDILDISKIQSNLLRVDASACNIYEVIDQVYSLVKIEIEKRGMVFVSDVEKNLPFVMADKDRLIQVLMNLLNNAVKFTREKSRITLLCRRKGDCVEFSVKDEGSGIPSEELSRLFGRFVQVDSTLVRRVGGTGLGLYISKNLVEAMGGKIWAESKLDEGSIFSFTIPTKKEHA